MDYFLYLHGYKGSAVSPKAVALKQFLSVLYPHAIIEMPSFDVNGKETLFELSLKLDQAQGRKCIIGSSLGGFMAHIFMQDRDDISAVILINPAMVEDLYAFIQAFDLLSHEYLEGQHLIALAPKEPISRQQDYLLLLQQDDTICLPEHSIRHMPEASIDLQYGQGHDYESIAKGFDAITVFLRSKEQECL
ncbi:MAG: YqiA/YcfP family alpha/beta fold hydrolase [Francisellaceae bacterium]